MHSGQHRSREPLQSGVAEGARLFALRWMAALPGSSQQLSTTESERGANYYTHTARIDHNFSPHNRLFVRGNGYSRNTWRNDYFNTRATGLREQYLPISGSIDDVMRFLYVRRELRYGYTRHTRKRFHCTAATSI